MADSLIGYIDSTIGRITNYWNRSLTQLELLRKSIPDVMRVATVANGTPTSDFYLQWSPYAIPTVAFVIEQSVPVNQWVTYDGGGNWTNLTGASSIPTGAMIMGLSILQTGYLWVDGSAYDIASYSTLNTHLNTVIGATNRRYGNRLKIDTWTSGSDVTFEFRRTKNGISNGDSVNLYWGSGFTSSRLAMTVGSASTTGFNLSGGAGDSIPNTAINFYWEFAATKFTLPDMRDVILYGAGDMDGSGSSTSIQSLTQSGAVTFPAQGSSITSYDTDYGDMYFPINIQIKT